MSLRTVIRGTGRCLPDRVVTNDDLTQWMDTSDEWIRARSGIAERRWTEVDSGIGPSDLGKTAAETALARAGWKPADLDLILFATLSPDVFFPGSGCLLQHKLGLETTPAMDIHTQCSGFVYSLATADAFVRSGQARRILLVGAEVNSTGLDLSTRGRQVSVLFGDGAGAACVEAVESEAPVGLLSSVLNAQGEFAESLMLEAPSARNHPRMGNQQIEECRHYPVMDGRQVFKHAVRRMVEAAGEALKRAGISIDDVDLLIPHQANLRISQGVQKFLGLSDERVFNNIQRYGNTNAASLPIAIDEAIEQGRLRSGMTLLMVAFGSGFTWGGAVYRMP